MALFIAGPRHTRYGYDPLGNLVHAELPDGTRIDYLADGRNRRVGKKLNGALVQGFLWQDQLKPAAELDGQGNVVARFVYGTRPNVPEYMIRSGASYRIVTDHLGSVRLVVNASTGAVAQRLDYDAWGRVLFDTQPGFQPFGFAGGLYDQHTGLVRFGARDYDPATGRWTAKDPIGFAGGDTGLYSYVRGSPVGYVDFNGMDPATGVAVGGAAGGPIGAVVGGLIGLGIGIAIGDAIFNSSPESSNADKPPSGSRDISDTQWSGDHGGIKDVLGLGGGDKVKIDPEGNVWVQHPDGSWSNEGPAGNFTGSGEASGKTGKDREKRRCRR